jgi:hypothetical protein
VLEREIERITGVKPAKEMIRSVLHVKGWQSYYSLERPREQVWEYIFELYGSYRNTVTSPDERHSLDRSELKHLVCEATVALESGVAHHVVGAVHLCKTMKSMAGNVFSMRQRVRYEILFGLPAWALAGIREIRSVFRRVMQLIRV